MKRQVILGFALFVGVMAAPVGNRPAQADAAVIRLASLAPRGSSWDKVFRAWSNTLEKQTHDGVKFRLYQGGVAGDERDVIRKMKVGQLDAASLTVIGLGRIVRSVTLLQMPIFDGYDELNRVRAAMVASSATCSTRRATTSSDGATPVLDACSRIPRSWSPRISGGCAPGSHATTPASPS